MPISYERLERDRQMIETVCRWMNLDECRIARARLADLLSSTDPDTDLYDLVQRRGAILHAIIADIEEGRRSPRAKLAWLGIPFVALEGKNYGAQNTKNRLSLVCWIPADLRQNGIEGK
jgi:hypothetical protein